MLLGAPVCTQRFPDVGDTGNGLPGKEVNSCTFSTRSAVIVPVPPRAVAGLAQLALKLRLALTVALAVAVAVPMRQLYFNIRTFYESRDIHWDKKNPVQSARLSPLTGCVTILAIT